MKKILRFFIAILAMFVVVGNASAKLQTTTIGPAAGYGFLNGPDGLDWVYTTSFTEEKGYYTHMEIKIYDGENNLVSTISDSLNVEGAVGVRLVNVQPYLTKKFFNQDNNYEVMVFVYANTADYKGKYLHYIYSLSEGAATKLYDIEGSFHMAENMSVNSYSEVYTMVFQREERGDDNTLLYHYDIYAKASYFSNYKAEKKHTFTVDYKYISSSGEEPSPILMVNNGGKANYVLAQYEKPYFTIPDDVNQDLILNEGNSLIIKYYDENFALKHETKIPVELSLEYLYSFPHLGSLNMSGDIMLNYNGSDTPAYLITEKNYQTSSDSYVTSYKLYDVDGKKLKDIADKVISSKMMGAIVGQPQQWMFAREIDEYGVFTFVDFPACDVVAELPVVTKDEVVLSSSIDRYGKGTSYQYAVALLQGEMASDGSVQHKIAWFDKDGSFDRYDVLNLGKGVENAMFNISTEALNPHLFNNDNEREYMALLTKTRENSSAKDKVLAICSTNGNILLELGSDAEKGGDLGSICLLNTRTQPLLMCPYSNGRTITLQYTELPLNTVDMKGEGTAKNPYEITCAYDFTKIENDLDAYYKVVNDIDFMNATFTGVKGEFTGKLDGGNFEIRNLVLDGCGLFHSLRDSAEVENLVLRNTVFSASKFVDAIGAGILANEVMGTFTESGIGFGCRISNVHIVSPSIVALNGFGGILGGIVGDVSLYTTIEGCSMSYANIYAPTAESVGGIAGKIATSTIVSACAFDGKIEAGDKVGGIVSLSSADDKILNCHVTADIFGNEVVGGIVGLSERSMVANCYIEGMIELAENTEVAKAGGVIGAMGGTLSDSVQALVVNNIVALDSMNIPTGAESYVHRIVGFSNGDTFEYDYDKMDPESPKEEWPKIYNEPEKCLKNNYVVSDLIGIDAEVEMNDTTTEGATMERSAMTEEWLKQQDYKFGEVVATPWKLEEGNDLRLWFETFEEVFDPDPEPDPEPDSVENVEDNKPMVVWFEGEELVAEGEFYLFNVSGQLMKQGVDRMNVGGLPAGVYVVRTAETAAKVIIR